jgi:NAD(P)-dependent dehydrogenase (short-subunit alcohol dehydrogenase family)
MRNGYETALNGHVALVTGGGSGLGAAICRTLARSGARVIVADVRYDAACRTAGAISDAGGYAVPVLLDVSDDRQAHGALRELYRQHPRIDILVNNAGVDVTRPADEIGIDEWDRIIGVNLRGPFVLARAMFPEMRQMGGGHVVNIVSTAAKRAWANASAYHASKWGLLGLSYALHVEGRPHNIRVTAVIAGGMRTPFLLDRFPDIDLETLQDPADVAETVRFVLTQPEGTVIPEVMVLPLKETSWP